MRSVTVRRWLVLAFVTLGVVRGAAAQEPVPPPAPGVKPAAPAEPPAGAPMPEATPHKGEEKHEDKDKHEEHHDLFEEHHEHHECECPEGKWVFKAEYLLMQPQRRGLDFAISDPNRDGNPQGVVEHVNWEADSGVRAGGGYRMGEEGWEVGMYYTYFYSATQRFVTAPPGGTLYATLTHPGFVDAVDVATGTSSFKYQLLDLEFGKHIEAGENCSVFLVAGGRYAWIDQALNASYDGQSAFQSRVRDPIGFDGPGIRVGGEGEWKINHHFGLYANAYASLISGRFTTSLNETNNAGASVITDITERFRKIVPVSELGIGVSFHWENWSARLGYQMVDWYGLVDSPDIVHDFSNKLDHRTGDVSLDGLNLRLELDF